MKATLSIVVGAIQAEHYREVHLLALGHQRSWTSGLRTERPGLPGLQQVDGGQPAARLAWVSACLCPHIPGSAPAPPAEEELLPSASAVLPRPWGPACAQDTG